MNKLVYLAGPYSYNPQAAFEKHLLYTAKLMIAGFQVFSPIAHNHQLAVDHGLPTDHEFWQAHNKIVLLRCDEVFVMTEPGWQNSKGTQFEINLARDSLIPVRYLKVADDMISIKHTPPE